MESDAVDFGGSRDHERDFSVDAPATAVDSDETGKDGKLLADCTVSSTRPGSLTLMETLERNRRETTKAGFRPLPKALQPKEIRRGSQPAHVPPVQTGGVRKATAGQSQPSSGVSVPDSVSNQQRRSSDSKFAASPTVKPSNTALSPPHVSAKPEVLAERPEAEKGNSDGGRHVVREPIPGLMTLRSLQRQHVTKATTISHRSETKIPSDDRPKSFSDILSFFELPAAAASESKSASYTPTTSKYSRFSKFTFEVDKPQSIVTAETPIADSMSNTVADPSPTISRMPGEQQIPTIDTSQTLLETHGTCPETISVSPRPDIQIVKSIKSPAAAKDDSDFVSTFSSTASDPVELGSNSIIDIDSCRASSEVEFQDRQDKTTNVHQGCSSVPAFNDDTTNRASDNDDDDDDDDDDVMAIPASREPDGVLDLDAEDTPPPPLPSIPPPRIYVPLQFDEENADDDDDVEIR